MNTSNLKKSLGILLFLMGLLVIVNCSSDDSSSDGEQQINTTPLITVSTTNFNFGSAEVSSNSSFLALIVGGVNLNSVIDITTTEAFEVSLDGAVFSDVVQLSLIHI